MLNCLYEPIENVSYSLLSFAAA